MKAQPNALDMLFKPGLPGLYLTGLNNHAFEQLQLQLQSVDSMSNVFLLKGYRCRTRAGFFQEISESLRIPFALDREWNALTNALVDLSWLGGHSFLLMIDDAPLFLSEDRTDLALRAALQEIATVNEAWSEQYHMGVDGRPRPTAFNVLFGCLEPEVPGFTFRVAQAGSLLASFSTATTGTNLT